MVRGDVESPFQIGRATIRCLHRYNLFPSRPPLFPSPRHGLMSKPPPTYLKPVSPYAPLSAELDEVENLIPFMVPNSHQSSSLMMNRKSSARTMMDISTQEQGEKTWMMTMTLPSEWCKPPEMTYRNEVCASIAFQSFCTYAASSLSSETFTTSPSFGSSSLFLPILILETFFYLPHLAHLLFVILAFPFSCSRSADIELVASRSGL